jgi:Cys-tRNA(Pro)/Cys-tRNA(Cys) deacylase
MAPKLNSMRWLDQQKMPYEVLEYPDNIHDAEEVAEALGLPYFMVYKTLVAQPEGQDKPALAIIPSELRLDLKRLAQAAGVKKARMVSHKDAEAMTGLKVGGISALALREKHWPVYLDQSASELEHIVISAGQRGIQIRVPTGPLISLLRPRLAAIATDVDE